MFDKVKDWFREQPKKVKVAVVAAILFVVIVLLANPGQAAAGITDQTYRAGKAGTSTVVEQVMQPKVNIGCTDDQFWKDCDNDSFESNTPPTQEPPVDPCSCIVEETKNNA